MALTRRSLLDGGKRRGLLSGEGSYTPPLQDQVSALEAESQAAGAPSVAQDNPGLGRKIIDVISRTQYASAGAAEEAFSPQGGGISAVPGRIANELFSGMGGFKGQKEGFGQVMEQAGVGKLGSLADINPWIPRESALDITGRGALGFAGDVLFDPLTYVTAGSKGIKFLGAKIPGTATAIRAARDATKATIKAVPAFERTADAVGKLFNRDWGIRNLPGAVELKQAHLDRQNYEVSLLYDELSKSRFAAIPKRERASFVDAMDQGTWAEKYKSNPKMLEAAEEWTRINKAWAERDVAHGILDPERVRVNYAAHFYDNTPEELRKVASLWKGKSIPSTELGRHAEMRAFDTLAQAENWTKSQHALDASVPILKPVRDPLEIMRRRGVASINAIEYKQYYQELADRYAKSGMPFSPEDIFDLTKEIPVSPVEGAKIESVLKSSSSPAKMTAFSSLSGVGKQEFMRQRLLASKEPSEVMAVLRKYGVDNAPKQKTLLGTLAEDGTPYVKFNAGPLKDVELPKSLVDDLQNMSERVLKSQELDHVLRIFDKANNVFKSFVTVMFPAFHARNAYSNVAQGFADVGVSMLNPARHYEAISALKGISGEMSTKLGSIPYKTLQEEMAKNGVTTTGRRLAEYTGKEGIERLSTVGGKIKAAPRAFGGMVENEARATLYTIYRRRGMDAAEAANRTKQILFDYTNLSRVEQDVFRRIIPFYTWQKKNIAQQFRNITTKPGLTAAEIKAVSGRDSENDMLTSWDSEAMKIRLNGDGKTLRVLSGVDLPIGNLDLLWNGSMRSTARQGLGMVTPVLKFVPEIAFGSSAFTGTEFGRKNSPLIGWLIDNLDPPKVIQNWLMYDKKIDAAGRPQYTFDGERFYILFQSWVLSRIVSTSDRQFRAFAEDKNWAPLILNVLTGMQDKTFNLKEEQDKKFKQRIKQLEDNLVRSGARNRYETTYKPKATP